MLSSSRTTFLSLFALIVFTSSPVQSDSACKGVEKSVCEKDHACRWVNSYKRSDGAEIKGYCRALPIKQVKPASK